MMTPRWQNHYAATIFKELLHTIAPLRKFCQATVVVHTGEGETKLNRPTVRGFCAELSRYPPIYPIIINAHIALTSASATAVIITTRNPATNDSSIACLSANCV
jgi:hypothetical protein